MSLREPHVRFWKPNRRWLQFSVRGLLLLTLAVALWLGYEVREARRVERATAAIRDWGGEVEWARGGWSLAKFIVGGAYGQRIVKAEIPGEALGYAIDVLKGSSALSEVVVVYDGSNGIWQNWDRLNASLPGRTIVATNHESLRPQDDERYRKMTQRVADRLQRGNAKVRAFLPVWRRRAMGSLSFIYPVRYHILRYADGTLLELLLGTQLVHSVPGSQYYFAILIVDDNAVDCVGFETSTRVCDQDLVFEDLDGDGFPELGFGCDPGINGWGFKEVARKLRGDPRSWLDVYKIEPDGFHSMLSGGKAEPVEGN